VFNTAPWNAEKQLKKLKEDANHIIVGMDSSNKKHHAHCPIIVIRSCVYGPEAASHRERTQHTHDETAAQDFY